MYQDGGMVHTSTNGHFAFETGVERRCVEHNSKVTQEGEQVNISMCVTEKVTLFSPRYGEAPEKNVPLPEFSLVMFEEIA